MRSETMVFGASTRRAEAWRVYQLRTANSVYELEVQVGDGPRRCTVLTKLGANGEGLQSFEDSQPRLGERCLYDVSPLEWMGQSLSVGTACTSRIQAVDFVKEAAQRRAPTTTMVFAPSSSTGRSSPAAKASSASSAPPSWAPFPMGCVEMLEAAGSVLGAVCHRHDLPAALARDPKLAKRFRLALAQCGVLVETLSARHGEPEETSKPLI